MAARPRKTTMRKSKQTDDANLKHALLDAALRHVPFDGFGDKALLLAAEEVGADRAAVTRLFPDGGRDLLSFFSETIDVEMESALAKRDLKSRKVRERIAIAIRERLSLLRPHKEATRRAMAFLSLPPNLVLATKLLYRTVDAMWRAAGDTSTDFNFYTKRAILAGVLSSTLMRWLTDHSEGEAETERFLDARIENVMQLEKVKAQVREGLARMPSPFGTIRSPQS